MSAEGRPEAATIVVKNIDDITKTTGTILSGVAVMAGRNATSRISPLRAIMGTMGSDGASLKGNADKDRVDLKLAGETYMRGFRRQNGQVVTGGDPYPDGRGPLLVPLRDERRTARRRTG